MTRPSKNQPHDWDFRIFEIIADDCSEMETRLSGYARDIVIEPCMDWEGVRFILNDYLVIQLGPTLAHALKDQLSQHLLDEYPWVRTARGTEGEAS